MKLPENYSFGSAIAASVLNDKLLSLLLMKKILSREEVFDLLETALLTLEQIQADFAVASRRQQFEDHLRAARLRIEEIRIALDIRHPSNPHRDQI